MQHMYIESDYQKKFNECLLDTLDKMMAYLDSKNLKFWIAYGSAIGAVRHKGLIPWDDDIDIIMLRDDYNKLLQMKDDIQKAGLSFVTHDDEGYYFAFGKIYNNNTTLWELKKYPYLVGVYVDIFPIDRTDLPKDEIYKKWTEFGKLRYRYFRSLQRYSIKDILKLLYKGKFSDSIKAIKTMLFYRNYKKYHDDYSNYEKSLNCEKGNNYVLYIENPSDAFIYKAEWFSETEYVDFEKLKVPIPLGNHQILKACYGDYMTPPPENERYLSHDFMRHYINLNKRLSFTEVKEQLRKGYKCEY